MRKGKSAGRPEQFIWQNLDSEIFHVYNSKINREILWNKDGEKIKKFKIDITGVASSAERKHKDADDDIFHQAQRRELVYSPQPNKFEGYSWFPRPASRPYNNKLQYFEANVIKVPSEIFTGKLLNKSNESTLRNNSASFLTNNIGVSHLTGASSSLKAISNKAEFIKELDSKLKLNKVRRFIINQNTVHGEHPYKRSGDGNGIAELRKEIKQGKFKITKDVGKIVALKHIFERNSHGTMVHGRNLKSPVGWKTQYFAERKKSGNKSENLHHRSMKAGTTFNNLNWNPNF